MPETGDRRRSGRERAADRTAALDNAWRKTQEVFGHAVLAMYNIPEAPPIVPQQLTETQ